MLPWLQPTTLLKATLLHGCFSRFLNYTNGTTPHKASHLNLSFQFQHNNKKKTLNFFHVPLQYLNICRNLLESFPCQQTPVQNELYWHLRNAHGHSFSAFLLNFDRYFPTGLQCYLRGITKECLRILKTSAKLLTKIPQNT